MQNEHCQPCGKIISWNAILIGALVALGLTFLFNLLTVAIGLTLFTKDPSGQMILTFAGFAWILIGGYVILFLAGWAAGRIVSHRHSLHGANGALHGFLAWTAYLLISLFALSHMAADSAAVLLRTVAVNTQTQNEITLSSPNVSNNDVANTRAESRAESREEVKKINKSGLATFATFFIFLVGAIGCCVGASYGIRESRRCHEKCALDNQNHYNNPNPNKPMQNP